MGRGKEIQGSHASKGKEKIDLGEQRGERKKRLANEAMMNTVRDDIAINTIEAVLSGDVPPS